MSGALSAAAGGPEVVAGEVFRSELNPVDFLVRAAFVYPEKVAVVDGGRRYCYRELAERSWRLASALVPSALRPPGFVPGPDCSGAWTKLA